MAITLAQMRTGMDDKVAQQVVDTFIRHSQILELLPFDNCVSPGGGSTLVYGYVQKLLPSLASFRALNSEYSPSEATVEKKSVELKIFGGKFQIDRVVRQAESRYDNMQFQIDEKILAAISLFHNTLINGDSASDSSAFDGLDKTLAGMSTEYGTDKIIDLSTMEKLKANADEFYESLTRMMNDTAADALLLNGYTMTKIQTVARVLGYKTESEEAFGRRVMTLDGKRMIDLGNHYAVSGGKAVANPVVSASLKRTVGSSEVTGLSDIYAVKFDANDGFLGATLSGNNAISTYLPDFNAPGAVKEGEVEMVGASVLKNTQHAGVLRNIKVA